MPVVDFHLHAYDFPINAPGEFVEFMDKQLGSSFAKFTEQYSTTESYLALLDEAGVDYGIVLAELAPITSAIGGNDTVAREDEREAVLGAEAPGRARRTRPAGQGGELAVRDDLAPRHRLERSSELGLEGGAPGEIDVDVFVRDPLTAEVAVEAAAQIRYEGVTLIRTGTR